MSGVIKRHLLAALCLVTIVVFIYVGWEYTGVYHLKSTQINTQQDVTQPLQLNSLVAVNLSNIQKVEFALDSIPKSGEALTKSETIHICLTIGGAPAALEARFLIRSLFIHSLRGDLHFHFLVTDDAKLQLEKIMSDLAKAKPAVNVVYQFYKFEPDLIKQKAKAVHVRITHHSGVFGMSKSFMYSVLGDVEKCLILDTDLVFGTDPAFLWANFKFLTPPYLGMLKIGTSDNDMCSGVMLQRFSAMRKANFELLYDSSVPKFCQALKDQEYLCPYGDQSMFYAVHTTSPVFKDLKNSWTLELCHEFRGHTFHNWKQSEELFFGIVHFNCLQLNRGLHTIDQYMEKFKITKLGQYLLALSQLKTDSLVLGNGSVTYLH